MSSNGKKGFTGPRSTRSNNVSSLRTGKKRFNQSPLKKDGRKHQSKPSKSGSFNNGEDLRFNTHFLNSESDSEVKESPVDSANLNEEVESISSVMLRSSQKRPPTTTNASSSNTRQKIDRHSVNDHIEHSGEPAVLQIQFETETRLTELESRVARLEYRVTNLSAMPFTTKGGRNNKLFEFSTYQSAQIGIACREDFFKSIKYFDQICQRDQGARLLSHCLKKAGMNGEEADVNVLEKAMKKKILRFLSEKRAHVTKAIRDKAKGMEILFCKKFLLCMMIFSPVKSMCKLLIICPRRFIFRNGSNLLTIFVLAIFRMQTLTSRVRGFALLTI